MCMDLYTGLDMPVTPQKGATADCAVPVVSKGSVAAAESKRDRL